MYINLVSVTDKNNSTYINSYYNTYKILGEQEILTMQINFQQVK